MRLALKYAAAVALTGALALAAATPSEARHWRNGAAIGGFAAGALIGAAAASAANNGYYYGPGYYEPGYAYAPGYAYYEPGYAYEPDYAYVAAPTYRYGWSPGYHWSRQHSTNNFSISSQR